MAVKIGLVISKKWKKYEVLVNDELLFCTSNKDFNIGSLVVIYEKDNQKLMYKIEEII